MLINNKRNEMNIEILKNTNGEFICLSDIMKIYKNKYGLKYNICQSLKNIPEIYIIKSRGRLSKTYIDIKMINIFFSTKRNIPSEFKNEILSYVGELKCLPNNYESLFIDILIGFLKGMFVDIQIKRQYTLNNKTFDLLIGNKILLEFDEFHHKYNKEIDNNKDKIGNSNNYKLIRVNSNCDYGLEISKIYKIVKNIMF